MALFRFSVSVVACNHATIQGAFFIDAPALVWRSILKVDSLQTDTMQNYVDKLLALRRLQVDGHPTKVLRVLEVIWRPPLLGWLKVNTDVITFRDSGFISCARVFRTYKGSV